MPDPLAELVELSRWLGEPARDCVLFGEGNASAAVGDASFYVKASGAEMASLDARDLVRIDHAAVLAVVDGPDLGDDELRKALAAARLDPEPSLRPSVETAMHAVCLAQPGVRFVGHSHPTAINALTCCKDFEKVLAGRIFHDEVLLCGPEPVLLPFVESGPPLARAVRDAIAAYTARHAEPPRTIYLQNHGLVALGATAREVQATTAMAIKSASIRAIAASAGGVHPLAQENVDRIHTRPDERYRRLRMGDR